MIIGVAGSRSIKDKEFVEKYLDEAVLTGKFVEFVTGGAEGVDTIVESYCKRKKIPCQVIRPVDTSNKINYLFRNCEIIAISDNMLVFWDGISKGTKFV